MYCRCLNFLEPRHTLHPWLLLSCTLPILDPCPAGSTCETLLLTSLLWPRLLQQRSASYLSCRLGSHCDLPYIGSTSCPVDYSSTGGAHTYTLCPAGTYAKASPMLVLPVKVDIIATPLEVCLSYSQFVSHGCLLSRGSQDPPPLLCPVGTYSSTPGQSSDSTCQRCLQGSYCLNAGRY
jgi:hypothetical protein